MNVEYWIIKSYFGLVIGFYFLILMSMVNMMNDYELNKISGKILDSSIEVHRNLGPGQLESVYQKCLCKEFKIRGINIATQVQVPVYYKSDYVSNNLKVDVLVEKEIIIELKSVEHIHPVHSTQLLSYLRLMNKRLGLLINFNVPRLIDRYKRVISHIRPKR